jgi:hypothetical protein
MAPLFVSWSSRRPIPSQPPSRRLCRAFRLWRNCGSGSPGLLRDPPGGGARDDSHREGIREPKGQAVLTKERRDAAKKGRAALPAPGRRDRRTGLGTAPGAVHRGVPDGAADAGIDREGHGIGACSAGALAVNVHVIVIPRRHPPQSALGKGRRECPTDRYRGR